MSTTRYIRHYISIAAAAPTTRVHPMMVARAAIARRQLQPRLRTRAFLRPSAGYVTAKPPVRHPLVLLQAVNRINIGKRIKTRSVFIRHLGGSVVPPSRHVPKMMVVLQAVNRGNL